MPWSQHYRHTFINHVRSLIGDNLEDKLLFSEDELKSYIDKWMSTDITTAYPQAFNERYRIHNCCNPGQSVYQLEVTVGVDDAVYILDEFSASILYAADDPANLAASPVDGSSITVTYYCVNKPELLSELFMELSSNHAKLSVYYNMTGMAMSLTKLSDAFYAQAVRWKAEASC